jgi:hypothetical protein
MKFTTIFCTAAFLFCIIHGRFDLEGMHRAAPHRSSARAVSENRKHSGRIREIDQKITRTRSIIKRLERSEKLLVRRIEEIRRAGRSLNSEEEAYLLSRGSTEVAAMLSQLIEVKEEQESALTLMERLKTERVRIEVQRDIRKTAADRRSIDDFDRNGSGDFGRTANGGFSDDRDAGPVERHSREIDDSEVVSGDGIRYGVF